MRTQSEILICVYIRSSECKRVYLCVCDFVHICGFVYVFSLERVYVCVCVCVCVGCVCVWCWCWCGCGCGCVCLYTDGWDEQAICNAIHALAMVGSESSRSSQLVDVLCNELQTKAEGGYMPQGIANAAWGLAVLQVCAWHSGLRASIYLSLDASSASKREFHACLSQETESL